jgi:MFS family permease
VSALVARIPGSALLEQWSRTYRSALARRDLRLLFGGLLVSATGSWAYNVALLAFVFDRTGSLAWVGAAGLVRCVPPLILSPYGGVVAERTERIRLMVGADVICAIWQGALAAVAATGAPVVLALVFAGLTAAANVVYEPAVAATIPSIVDEQELVAANALNGTIDNLVVVAGPAVGAVLLALSSAVWVFAINGASFAAAALIVSRIRARSRPVDVTEEGAAGPLRQMTVGARTIARLPAARTLVAFSVLVSFVYGTDTVLFVGVSAHRLGTGAQGFGYLMAGLGIGGIAIAATVDRLARSRRLAPIIIAGTVGYCLPTALLTVIHNPELAFAIQIARGASTLVVDVLAVTALQRAVPSHQLARVFGTFSAFFIGAIALGTVVTPAIVSALGLNAALLLMAFGPTAVGLLGWPALVSVDRRTAARADELAGRVSLLERLDMFAAASRPMLERLAGVATEVSFASGAEIIREGDPANALYVLAAGDVEVCARGERGGPQRFLRTMHAPTYFGEIGVLKHVPRTATVRAMSTCRCERMEGADLLEALNSTPPSASLMENARSRLALTHPSVLPEFREPVRQ